MDESFWKSCARREAWKFNFGWWLQLFLPWMIAAGLITAVVLLALRSTETSWHWAAIAAGVLLLVGLVVSFVMARKKFLTRAESLARLDGDLRLHNRLVSAAEGVGDWPQPRDEAKLKLQWNWRALCWPPLAAAALVIAAAWIPIPNASAFNTKPKSEPTSWTATQEKIDVLKKEELVQQPALEELQQALDALRKQPSEQWFSHESLEAGDHLEAQTTQGMAELQKNLETALGALEASRQIEQSQLAALNQPLSEALKQALNGMELGKLPLDEKLLSQLKGLDPSKIRQMSAEEFKKLCDKLKAGTATCSNGFCKKEGQGDALLALIAGQGNGGISRGPGAAPLTLKDQETHLGTDKIEAVKSDDLSHAAIGDVMGMTSSEHKVDKNVWSGPQSGGGMTSEGAGGDAVWQQPATPEEQAALRRFFK